jgi:predicted TIM-barrel fold metal-dependent hydrolase
MTVDAWMQHPTPDFLRHDMYESLRAGPAWRRRPRSCRSSSRFDDVALDFPELTIVGGHIGYPCTEE